MRGPRRLLVAAFVTGALVSLTACGGRFTLPDARRPAAGSHGAGYPATPSGTLTTGAPAPAGGAGPSAAGTPTGSAAGTTTSTTSPSATTGTGSDSSDKAITTAYESYLSDLSALDDTLNKSYLAPLASVTTNRLAQATARQAAAILDAQEHGVGMLRDDHLEITMTGPATAALADCQDEDHFYLVSDDSGTPDAFVARGYFVGSAQLLVQDGHWLVDTFTTTHVPCTF